MGLTWGVQFACIKTNFPANLSFIPQNCRLLKQPVVVQHVAAGLYAAQ